MTDKIELFHFGYCGKYDELNPFYLFEKENVPETLFLIADSEPFDLNAYDIARLLDCELNDLKETLKAMEKLNMVLAKNDRYSINFPVFLEKDLYLLHKFSRKTAQRIGDLIIMNKEKLYQLASKLNAHKYFNNERLLYHIIGDYIFDGTAIDYFGANEIFKISKEQLGGRNYILIGFEKSKKVFDFSDNILCSSNNYKVKNIRFNSFGDSNGNRKDLYRFFRQVNSSLKNATKFEKLNLSYIKLIEEENHILAENCAIFIERLLNEIVYVNDLLQEEKNIFEFLKELGYIKEDKKSKIDFNVPVFHDDDIGTLQEMSKYILDLIQDELYVAFKGLNNDFRELSAIKHNVDIKEIANELWHQVFGSINEYLVEKIFFQKPNHIDGQGRFFQSIYIE